MSTSKNITIEVAIIPVAGHGTRLLPISKAVPKELLPLGRKPALQYIAEELGRAGARKIVLVTSESKPEIDRLFVEDENLCRQLRATGKSDLAERLWSASPYKDLQIELAVQPKQLGLGHAVLCAEEFVEPDQPIVVALGDCVIGAAGHSAILHRMQETLISRSADIVIAVEEVPQRLVSQFGIVAPKSNGEIFELADVVEKPSADSAPSNLAIAARYILPPSLFGELKKVSPARNQEIQLTDAISNLIARGARAFAVRLDSNEPRFDVGNLESYTRAFVEFALADPALRQAVMEVVEERES